MHSTASKLNPIAAKDVNNEAASIDTELATGSGEPTAPLTPRACASAADTYDSVIDFALHYRRVVNPDATPQELKMMWFSHIQRELSYSVNRTQDAPPPMTHDSKLKA